MIEALVSTYTIYLSIYIINYRERHKTNWIINILITTILCYAISLFDKRFTLLTFLLASIILLRKNFKNIKRTIFVVIISIIINMLVIYLNTIIYYKILGATNNISSTQMLIISYSIVIILVAIISKLLSMVISINLIDFNEKYMYLLAIVCVLFVCIIISNIVFNSYTEYDKSINIYSILIIIISAITIFMIYMGIKLDFKNKELDIKNIELINLQNYISVTETHYNEISKFKHDYINIISTLAGYIEEEDIYNLKIYFEDNIVPLFNNFENESLKLNILEKVNIIELKGLLKIKLTQAISKNIKVSVEVIEKIDIINWNVVDLCRVVGILIDNGIEAAEDNHRGFINIALFKKYNEIYIIIQNSFLEENISLQQIYKRGFSSKGSHRGLGLSIVKNILSKNRYVSIETTIDENIFTQILKICNN